MSRDDDDRWRAGDRERARRTRPDDDRGSGPIALAIVGAAAVSFALVVSVLALCALIFVYFFSAYVLARVLRLVRFPLRRLLSTRRGPAALVLSLPPRLARAAALVTSLPPRLARALRAWL